jgi:hypothetical protein
MKLRRAALVAAVLASASSALADVPIAAHGDRLLLLPPRRAVRAGYLRYQLEAAIPQRPYTRVHESEALPGFVSTAPLVLDDGSMVLGLSSPPGVVWVDTSGHVGNAARFDDRPAGDLAVGADGRIFVSGEGRSLFTLAPDGTVRSTVPPEPSMQMIPGPIVRDDGSVIVVANGATSGSVVFLSPSGERVATHTLAMRVTSASLGLDGCVWLLGSSGVGCLESNGTVRDASFGRGANLVVPITAHALGLIVANELQIRTPDGELRGRTTLGAPVQWIVPLPSGGVALLRNNPTQELMVLGPDATPLAHVPFATTPSGRVLGVLSDSAGALVAVTSDGTIVALEPDGAERWRLETRQRFARAAVPLHGGGFAVPLAEGGLLFVQ